MDRIEETEPHNGLGVPPSLTVQEPSSGDLRREMQPHLRLEIGEDEEIWVPAESGPGTPLPPMSTDPYVPVNPIESLGLDPKHARSGSDASGESAGSFLSGGHPDDWVLCQASPSGDDYNSPHVPEIEVGQYDMFDPSASHFIQPDMYTSGMMDPTQSLPVPMTMQGYIDFSVGRMDRSPRTTVRQFLSTEIEGVPQTTFGEDAMKVEDQEYVGKEEDEMEFESSAMPTVVEKSPLPQPVSPSPSAPRDWSMELYVPPGSINISLELRTLKTRFPAFPSYLLTRRRYKLGVNVAGVSDHDRSNSPVLLFGVVDEFFITKCEDIVPRAISHLDHNGSCCFRLYFKKQRSTMASSGTRIQSNVYRLYVVLGVVADPETTLAGGYVPDISELSTILAVCASPPVEIRHHSDSAGRKLDDIPQNVL